VLRRGDAQLKNKTEEATLKAYPKAVKIAIKEPGLNPATFPASCMSSHNELLDEDFYPENVS
jgi:hypothetical protein